jgi:uncharacterized protein (TIGR02328 family)
MRLWHQDLIPLLPRQQLLGQHRECAALRGNGWGKKHATVDYVFTYPMYFLYEYHLLVMHEMDKRGYKVDEKWLDETYRGKICKPLKSTVGEKGFYYNNTIYPEHNDNYLQECLINLKSKGVIINMEEVS